MIDNIGTVLTGKINPELKKYKREFDEFKAARNSRKCEFAVKFLIPLNIVLIFIDLFVYKPMWNDIRPYKYLFYSHIIVILLLLIWKVMSKVNRDHKRFIKEEILNTFLFYITISWCIFMGINSTRINGQISAYVVCIFCFAAFFHIGLAKAWIMYWSSMAIFAAGLITVSNDSRLLYGNLVNAFISTMLAHICSTTNYCYFVKEFLNKKILIENKLELETVNLKLKEYEKLRTDFFANISHELRTPLNVIYSAKQMIDVSLEQKNINDDKVNKYLKMITQNSHRLLRLINNLIDITKIDGASFEVKPVNADITKTVEDIVMSVADFIESKGISLTFDTEIEEKTIACDPDKIERIMLNLLSNAVKFTDNRGCILVNIYLEDNSVCIAVKDSGIGISEEMQELIFHRFIQVDKSIRRRREGSGIGLSLVKSLVEMQGGQVFVNSKLGEGTEFIIKLPDKRLPVNEEALPTFDLTESHIDRINIEFSDIYR